MKKLVIIGNTTNARLAHYYFSEDSDYEVVAFAVNGKYIQEELFCGLPVVPLEELSTSYPPQEFDAFVAVGYTRMNKIREDLYNEVKERGYSLPNYVSSHCVFLTKEPMGDNNLILESNVIQPFVKIGSNNVFWSGNHIGHDAVIKNHVFIASHVVVAGSVYIGDNCFLGVNSAIRDGIKILESTLVGAGATIRKSTEKDSVWVPPPAIRLRGLSSGFDI